MLKKLVNFSLPYAIMLLLLVSCAEKPKTFDEQYDLGVKYISEGNYEEAIIALSAAIEIEPNSAIAYLNRGNAYYEQKMLDNAIKYSLQGTTQGRYLTGGVPPVRFSM